MYDYYVSLGVNKKVNKTATVTLPKDCAKEEAIAKGKEALGDKLSGEIVREIYVPGRIINIVVK